MSIPEKEFRRPEKLFSVKVGTQDGIFYMCVKSINQEQISVLIKNYTDYHITLSNEKNTLEPSQDIKPKHQKPLIMRYPKLNGRNIILQFRDHLLKEEDN